MVNRGKTSFFKGRSRVIAALSIIVLIGIQFYRPGKNVQKKSLYNDFLRNEKAPENIAGLIKNSCYNCHSDYTDYYWYDHIAPASWYVDNHIKEAKSHLNFSKWRRMDYRDKRANLSRIVTELNEDKMPLASYTIMHPEAKLTEDEKKKIIDWLYTIEVR